MPGRRGFDSVFLLLCTYSWQYILLISSASTLMNICNLSFLQRPTTAPGSLPFCPQRPWQTYSKRISNWISVLISNLMILICSPGIQVGSCFAILICIRIRPDRPGRRTRLDHGRQPAPLNDHLRISSNNFLNFLNVINIII